MKFSPDPDSACSWFGGACAAFGAGGGFIIARAVPFSVFMWVVICLVIALVCIHFSIVAERNEK